VVLAELVVMVTQTDRLVVVGLVAEAQTLLQEPMVVVDED
jgi:hypothetical protein